MKALKHVITVFWQIPLLTLIFVSFASANDLPGNRTLQHPEQLKTLQQIEENTSSPALHSSSSAESFYHWECHVFNNSNSFLHNPPPTEITSEEKLSKNPSQKPSQEMVKQAFKFNPLETEQLVLSETLLYIVQIKTQQGLLILEAFQKDSANGSSLQSLGVAETVLDGSYIKFYPYKLSQTLLYAWCKRIF